MKPSILFMGTPDFALASLASLYNEGYPILAVFSQPDKPAGRGQKISSPPCAQFAREKTIPLLQPSTLKDPAVIQAIKDLNPDFIVVAAYGLFLPRTVLEIPRYETLNVHASLLPKYRGAAPIQWALIRGEKKTGVTLMRIIPQMDAGPVFATAELEILPQDKSSTLFPKLARLGGELLVRELPAIYEGELRAQEQDASQASLAPMLKKEMSVIDWTQNAPAIHHLIRGLDTWPVAHTSIDNQKLKIYDSLLLPDRMDEPPGTVYLVSEKGMHVACGHASLCVTEVQLEGKKRMKAADFARGQRLTAGKKLES